MREFWGSKLVPRQRFEKIDQPLPAFLLIFTKISWPPNILLYEYLNMIRPYTFQKQKTFYSTVLFKPQAFFFQHLNVVKFKKQQHFQQKAAKIVFL